jgi:hypothetical protein
MVENLEKRMYSLNLYNISPIQCGIQSYHSGVECIVEYILKDVLDFHLLKRDDLNNIDLDIIDWAMNWKTVILLNGGTTISLTTYLQYLQERGIKCMPFYEPDLGGVITSISFLLNSNSFEKENVPVFIDSFFKKFKYDEYDEILKNLHFLNELEQDEFISYKERIGDKNLFLKFFTSKFNLSNN